MIFMISFIVLMIVALIGMIYLISRFRRFSFMKRLTEKNKKLSWLVSFIPFLIIVVLGIFFRTTTIIAVLHLIVFWALCDFSTWIIRKQTGKKRTRNIEGAVAIIITVVYLGIGLYCGIHVSKTNYTVQTKKNLSAKELNIVLIADSHIGTTFDGNGFASYIEDIKLINPDALMIAGDFVDDDTSRDDFIIACDALGSLKNTCPVYYVFGNHDKGYFRYRDFTVDELYQQLQNNGVVILEDEYVQLNDTVCIIGRKDKSVSDRADMVELMSGIDSSKYTILLDHQPSDYDAEAAAKVDLVLSGHTHGGQMFPAGFIGKWSGVNDKVYGIETRDQTTFIVTSGISTWSMPFKTGTSSEYIVITLQNTFFSL